MKKHTETDRQEGTEVKKATSTAKPATCIHAIKLRHTGKNKKSGEEKSGLKSEMNDKVLYFIEGRFVKGAGYGLSVDMTSHLNWFLLVKIELQQAAELPLALITSIGIKYEYYSVYLPWFYRNRSGSKIIETVNNFLASGVW